MERLEAQLAFIRELDRLKGVQRRSHLLDDSRRENSAEHSWHIALLATVLAEHGPPGLDRGRVVQLCLAHDIVEIDAGDAYVYDTAARQAQAAREAAAAERIFGLLPADQGAWFRGLWEEFERGETAEARFARAVDRVMPLLHNLEGRTCTWVEHGVSLDEVVAANAVVRTCAPALWAWLEPRLHAAVADGRLRPSTGGAASSPLRVPG